MDKIIELLRVRIAEYKQENNLNTNTLRGLKIHDVGHDTIWKLTTKDDYKPSFYTIKKLLRGFVIPFEEKKYTIELLENEA